MCDWPAGPPAPPMLPVCILAWFPPMLPRLPWFPVLCLFPPCPAPPLPAPAPCRLFCSAIFSRPAPGLPAPASPPPRLKLRSFTFPFAFPASPAPAPAPWPWRSPQFPDLFSAPAPAAPPPAPSVLLNDLIASWLGFPLLVEARRFLSLAAACWRPSCSDVGPTLLALVIAFFCSAFGCAFIPPFPPLKLVRLAFTFLANELLT